MDIIEMTRELGRALQGEPAIIRYLVAKEANDGDADLQDMITEFNEKRGALDAESQNPQADKDELSRLDTQARALYQQIMRNENMRRFSAAQQEAERLLRYVTRIISESANGADPAGITEQAEGGCGGGSCAGCSGCS